MSTGAVGLSGLVGCRRDQPVLEPVGNRSDVPLRLLVCGPASAAEAIRIAWGGVAEQPLAIEVLSPDGEAPGREPAADGLPVDGFSERVVEATLRNDVALIPASLLPDLSAAGALATAGNDLLEAAAELGPLLTSIDVSLARWAGKPVGIPLGLPQPALLVSEASGEVILTNEQPPEDWSQFAELARDLNSRLTPSDGWPVVAEPLAAGDAAKAFLWRANDADPNVWLFDREGFQPVVSQATYVAALEALRECAELYGDRRLTAGEVWSGVANGAIRLAIGWPGLDAETARVTPLERVWVGRPPVTKSAVATEPGAGVARAGDRMVLPDPDAVLGAIGTRCRQTAVAKRFLVWLAGGEGSEPVRRAVPGMTVTRTLEREPAASATDPYDRYLADRLESLQVRPMLRLRGARRYWQILDRAVLDCLDGNQSASEALASVANQWEALTEQYGREEQAKAWRHAQGLRH